MLSSGICDEADEDDDVVVAAGTGGMPAPKKCGKIVLREETRNAHFTFLYCKIIYFFSG